MRGNLASRSTRLRPFDPRSISGLIGWFDGNDVGLPLADGATLTTWRDKSGAGNDLGQASGARAQPIVKLDVRNGLSVVRFARASSQLMSCSTASLAGLLSGSDKPFSVFYVFAQASVAATQVPWSWASSSTSIPIMEVQAHTAPDWRASKRGDDNVAVSLSSTAAAPSTTWRVHGFSNAGTTVTWTENGVLVSNAGALDAGTITATDRFAVGARDSIATTVLPFDGDIGELLVVNREVLLADHLRMVRWLGRRWQVFA